MFTVKKDNKVQKLYSENQLVAFEKAGWELVGGKADVETPEYDIDALKAEADELGISYMPNIGASKLAARIAERKANV